MDSFTKKSLSEIRKMQIEEIEEYYKQMRIYEFNNDKKLEGMEWRKKIHPLCYIAVKLDRILSKEGLYVLGDDRISTNNPIIFACTHIGGNDIQRTFEAIKDHAYLFLADPKELYTDITGKLLYLNGVIPFESNDKEDRKIAYQRSLELLESNTNLLLYPEGAWNISRNKPVMKLFPGAAKMAYTTGADIVPVAIEQYGNDFFVKIGKNMLYKTNYSNNIEEVNHDLRDNLAALKWDIWKNHGIQTRESITDEDILNFEQNIVSRCEYDFSIQDVVDTMYRDEDITDFLESKKLIKTRVLHK